MAQDVLVPRLRYPGFERYRNSTCQMNHQNTGCPEFLKAVFGYLFGTSWRRGIRGAMTPVVLKTQTATADIAPRGAGWVWDKGQLPGPSRNVVTRASSCVADNSICPESSLLPPAPQEQKLMEKDRVLSKRHSRTEKTSRRDTKENLCQEEFFSQKAPERTPPRLPSLLGCHLSHCF